MMLRVVHTFIWARRVPRKNVLPGRHSTARITCRQTLQPPPPTMPRPVLICCLAPSFSGGDLQVTSASSRSVSPPLGAMAPTDDIKFEFFYH